MEQSCLYNVWLDDQFWGQGHKPQHSVKNVSKLQIWNLYSKYAIQLWTYAELGLI